MASPRSSPGTLRERSFLVLGLGAALLLVLAALGSGGDPESAGRAELVSTAARIAEAVHAKWDGGTVLVSNVEESGAPLIEWVDGTLPFAEGRELVREPGAGHVVFDALLKQSEQVELANNDAAGALELAEQAMSSTEDHARESEARMRMMQLLIKQSRIEEARIEYGFACLEIDGAERRGPVSYRLLMAAAIAPSIPAQERDAFCNTLRDDLSRGVLAWKLPRRESVFEEVGEVDALLQMLEAACPGSTPRDFRRVRTGQALRTLLGDLPTNVDHEPHARRVGERFFTWRLEESGAFTGHLLESSWARKSLQRSIEGAGVVPDGFVVDIDPPASKATAVREHDVLDGDFGFTVKHEDPEGWIRRSAGRQKLLRGALLVLAVLSAAAGVATFRALRRERTLAVLKTDFVANVSHELRTPLASILLLSENLEAGRVAGEAERARYHSLIRREALRLRRLVDDVLDFSRLERGKRIDIRREALRVDPWLERACEELAEWAREHALELSIERSPTAAEAEFDSEALRRALLNLLDNARKHSGGAQVELAALREGRELVLRVRDHGRGISAEDRERVFEPFVRLSNGDAPGAGLGLSIVREIAREHGGSVRALDPTDGPGIVFEMRIPLAEETAA